MPNIISQLTSTVADTHDQLHSPPSPAYLQCTLPLSECCPLGSQRDRQHIRGHAGVQQQACAIAAVWIVVHQAAVVGRSHAWDAMRWGKVLQAGRTAGAAWRRRALSEARKTVTQTPFLPYVAVECGSTAQVIV